jgi:regulator of sirC expression with transglutaminase-like and TPR domain
LRWAEDYENDQELIERLIALRNRMEPRPQISEEAYAAMQRGVATVDNATSPKDFVAAEKAFAAAVMLAPWWPDALLNLAYTRETLGAYADAIQSFRLYLLAAPDADDSDKVRARIEELERKR